MQVQIVYIPQGLTVKYNTVEELVAMYNKTKDDELKELIGNIYLKVGSTIQLLSLYCSDLRIFDDLQGDINQYRANMTVRNFNK